MNPKLVLVTVVTGSIALIVIISLILLFHFGPPGISSGEDRILSSLKLTNDNRLYLVAHRTGDFIDAYKVSLVRVDRDTNVFVSWLGHEDGYWWNASLVPDVTAEEVTIRAFGFDFGVYRLSDGIFRWAEEDRKPIPSHRIDGIRVIERIPPDILPTNGDQVQ
jgi:hypothetical protein